MKRTLSSLFHLALTLFVSAWAIAAGSCNAQTILSGNISGTWSPSGNPYIISDNATVPSGQSLTIQPGVEVWIGTGLSLTINGGIQAIGNSSQRITFRPPVNSQFWNAITVNNSQTNVFAYCEFVNATNALVIAGASSNQVNYCDFHDIVNTALTLQDQIGCKVLYSSFQNVSNGVAIATIGGTIEADILSCSFNNCWGQAVGGVAGARYDWIGVSTGTINARIKTSTFNASGAGCYFNIYGNFNGVHGYANVVIMGNLFKNTSNAAIALTSGLVPANSTALLINNTIFNAASGAICVDPWDATLHDCIFVGCTNAVQVSGLLSRAVSYNDFYGNVTNFVGYPSTYGTIILVNRNGTPCDLLYNIFSDPHFLGVGDFHLQTSSPCIDAGTSDPYYIDTNFPPSQGTTLPDLGIYGGPLAYNWLPVVPPQPPAPVALIASRAVKLTCVDVVGTGAYQIQISPNFTSWANYGPPFIMSATSNFVHYVDATNRANYFRLQQLP
jgi:hypothetical protein